jgi:predicted MFS family arabinose efflux permease
MFWHLLYFGGLKMFKEKNTAIVKSKFVLGRQLVFLMAVASGVGVANIYYMQPLLAEIARAFEISQLNIGFVAMLTQIGYAFGLLLFVPIGDIKERRRFITLMALMVSVSLILMSLSINVTMLAISAFIIGLTAVVPQLIIPFAAHLAEPKDRGKVIGTVMSGLYAGILVSRTFSGIIGSAFGWRVVFWIAAALMVVLAFLLKRYLPVSLPTSNDNYLALLKSLWILIKEQRVLRESSIVGALMFGAFSAFWTSLIFLLETPVYKLGAQAAGIFGLVGLAGVLAAPVVGRTADKKSPRFTLGISIVIAVIAYIIFGIFGFKLWGLVIGVILLDLGIQSGQVSNLARIYSLDPNSRNRINAVFMVSYFAGGALGSFLGSYGWKLFQWGGVCAVGLTLLIAAFSVYIWSYRKVDDRC